MIAARLHDDVILEQQRAMAALRQIAEHADREIDLLIGQEIESLGAIGPHEGQLDAGCQPLQPVAQGRQQNEG